jgi:hypothetical protein
MSRVDNLCPQCQRPEFTYRLQGAERYSICGNGHGWKQKPGGPKQSELPVVYGHKRWPPLVDDYGRCMGGYTVGVDVSRGADQTVAICSCGDPACPYWPIRPRAEREGSVSVHDGRFMIQGRTSFLGLPVVINDGVPKGELRIRLPQGRVECCNQVIDALPRVLLLLGNQSPIELDAVAVMEADGRTREMLSRVRVHYREEADRG